MKIRKQRTPFIAEDSREPYLTGNCSFCQKFPKAAIRLETSPNSAQFVRYCEECLALFAKDASRLVKKLKGNS